MLARTALGIALLTAIVALGTAVNGLRRSGQPLVRGVATNVHWAAGVIAVSLLVLFGFTALRLLLD